DAREGLTAADEEVVKLIRRSGKPTQLVINKAERLSFDVAASDFFRLGMESPYVIAAAHGQGVQDMLRDILDKLPETEAIEEEAPDPDNVRVAIVGRPNVGKSTLVNRLLGEERVMAADMPGTTRDSIAIDFERDGRHYTLVDTAGVRRRSKVNDMVEKFSVIKTLQAMEQANVVVLMTDAQQDIATQDARLLGLVADSGRAVVIAVNKWDGVDEEQRRRVKSELDRRLPFLDYATICFTSALHGSGLGELFEAINAAHRSAMRELPTGELNRVLEQAVSRHQPPAIRGRRIKLRYAHQGGHNPPQIVIHGNQTKHVPDEYRRYLEHQFRKAFKLKGTPVQLFFKTGDNPYEGKRNKLTERQQNRRRRLKKIVRKKH
ncbi:MAG: ribosome biogenesis GTPase Der, partial [Spongiibacter sp.]|nr:ribosome biogenesis GTPase Der [Spongiibacter sp.]